jgi:bifunctional DNA-binding transcriptional regulator/antitoxin component of YhaV-PrlF toxin-antitoxin module
VRERGTLTLPAEVRKRHRIRTGDAYELLDLDGIFVLAPMTAIVPELAREIERARLEAGLSVDDMLRALREERARYVAEKYGDPSE